MSHPPAVLVAGLDLARTMGFLLADTGDNITGQTSD